MRLQLTPSELAICKHVGEMRHSITSKQGTERRQDASLDALQMSVDGVMTEYAVAKALNLFFDFNCEFRKFGADLIGKNGSTIDVKSTRKPNGNLNAVKWSSGKPADYFVLTEIMPFDIFIVGWIRRNDFLCETNLQDRGNGLFYSVDRNQLEPFNVKYKETT